MLSILWLTRSSWHAGEVPMNAKCRCLCLRGTFCLLLPFSLHPISSLVLSENVSFSCFSAQPRPCSPPPPSFHHICLPLSCYTTVICIHTGRQSHEGKTVLVFISGPYKSPLTPTPALVLSDFKWRRLTGSPLAFRRMISLQPCDRFFSPRPRIFLLRWWCHLPSAVCCFFLISSGCLPPTHSPHAISTFTVYFPRDAPTIQTFYHTTSIHETHVTFVCQSWTSACLRPFFSRRYLSWHTSTGVSTSVITARVTSVKWCRLLTPHMHFHKCNQPFQNVTKPE